MTNSERMDILNSVALPGDSNYIEPDDPSIVFGSLNTEEQQWNQFNEAIDDGIAKAILGSDYVNGATDYHMVTEPGSITITCNTSQGEKVFHLVDDSNLHSSSSLRDQLIISNRVKPSLLPKLAAVCASAFCVITIILICILLYAQTK